MKSLQKPDPDGYRTGSRKLCRSVCRMEPIATPSENFVVFSNVMTPMRLSEFVLTSWPTRSESAGRDDRRSAARSFTVPSTPPLNTTPRQVDDPPVPNSDVEERHVTR